MVCTIIVPFNAISTATTATFNATRAFARFFSAFVTPSGFTLFSHFFISSSTLKKTSLFAKDDIFSDRSRIKSSNP